MNKQYIKRQVTLHKLGLPMDDNVKKYYDYFHSLIGDTSNLKKLVHKNHSDSIFWVKDGEVILEYIIKTSHFFIVIDVWENFGEKYNLKYDNISELFGGLLEETFILKASTVDFDPFKEDFVWRKLKFEDNLNKL